MQMPNNRQMAVCRLQVLDYNEKRFAQHPVVVANSSAVNSEHDMLRVM